MLCSGDIESRDRFYRTIGLTTSNRDTLRGEKIHEAFAQIKASVFFGDKLRFRPLSERHRESLATLGKEAEKLVPTIESAVLFAGVKYQPLTVGACYGRLTLIHNTNNALQQKEEREKNAEGEKEPTKTKSKKNRKGEDEGEEDEDAQVFKCGWNDILLCEDVPNDIPVVAGLITGQLQTPLCHVALLCSNRWTPNMGLIEAWKDPRLTPLIGKWVRLTVDMQDFTIEEVTEEETRQWQREKIRALREGANIELPCNVEVSLSFSLPLSLFLFLVTLLCLSFFPLFLSFSFSLFLFLCFSLSYFFLSLFFSLFLSSSLPLFLSFRFEIHSFDFKRTSVGWSPLNSFKQKIKR